MKNPTFLFPKIFLLFFIALVISSCIKNDGSIIGDAKVRVFNTVISDTTRNFYFNNALFNSVSAVSALATSTNSSYFVVEAEKEYTIDSRNTITGVSNSSSKETFALGKNYSIYYTKSDSLPTTKPKMFIYQDTVRQNLNVAQVMFINYGYTLGSKVMITDRTKSFTETLGYGEKSGYRQIIEVGRSKTSLVLNLIDSTGVEDTISYTNFAKGKVYTVIIEGAKNGKLKERLVPNN
ncbi:hypothetical protein EZ449_06305 [Pedobacter frigidisoli]|uniref:DUF4397 domain-containing protein n=1 Tax=Pedobacter frigidisoli TaxID=2530455 RepID=A0A4R0P6J8_9SPHI|nr:DUF4397 domain-containing protein [Pedobacter frigidisoli]TCD11102.1 hypothetical protein EZ449_06305 [Pedobacter frigidisoli]